MPSTISYKFSQKFRVPAKEAYHWCTNYDPADLKLMGEEGKRSIERLSNDKIILYDSFQGGRKKFRKVKFVQLYPERSMWVSTHVDGPVKFSQFFYEIVPEGKNSSRLEFTGKQIDYGRNKSSQQISKLASKIRKEDSGAWKMLAKEMEKDLLVG